jgi:hypothetical protein
MTEAKGTKPATRFLSIYSGTQLLGHVAGRAAGHVWAAFDRNGNEIAEFGDLRSATAALDRLRDGLDAA